MGARPLAALLLVPLLTACDPSPLLPLLATTFPAEGQTIVRTAWLRAEFTEAFEPASKNRVRVFCNGVQVPRRSRVLDARTLVVQPIDPLPASASCLLRANTTVGMQSVSFQTRAAGPAFRTVHDRRDVDRPLPFPDDVFLTPDASQVTGWRPEFTDRLPLPGGTAQGYIHNMAGFVASTSDGWSPVTMITVQVDREIDADSLPQTRGDSLDPLSTIALLDLTPGSPSFGERVPIEIAASKRRA